MRTIVDSPQQSSGLVFNLRQAAYTDEAEGDTFLRGLETVVVCGKGSVGPRSAFR